MSTRSTVVFTDEVITAFDTENLIGHPAVYVHCDGYPEGVGRYLQEFIGVQLCAKDKRFSDPEYLALRFVLFMWRELGCRDIREQTGLGICPYFHGDLEFIYEVTPDREIFVYSGGGTKLGLLEDILETRAKNQED